MHMNLSLVNDFCFYFKIKDWFNMFNTKNKPHNPQKNKNNNNAKQIMNKSLRLLGQEHTKLLWV